MLPPQPERQHVLLASIHSEPTARALSESDCALLEPHLQREQLKLSELAPE
jgi:hypothetical protein